MARDSDIFGEQLFRFDPRSAPIIEHCPNLGTIPACFWAVSVKSESTGLPRINFSVLLSLHPFGLEIGDSFDVRFPANAIEINVIIIINDLDFIINLQK